MKNKRSISKPIPANIRWPFRLAMLLVFCFLFYIAINRFINHSPNTSIVFNLIGFLYFFILFGFCYSLIFRNKFDCCFFYYNYEHTKLFKYLTKESNKPKKIKKIYFKQARVKFDNFLASKLMVQIWGFLDLLTLVLFWQYFYNNFMLVQAVLFGDMIVKFSMIPNYILAVTSISLLFSGILLIIPNKLGGRIVGIQLLLKLFAYLPSIFPILWVMDFSIEHRYIKALVITTFCVELIRVETIRHYFKIDKNKYYSGYNHNDSNNN